MQSSYNVHRRFANRIERTIFYIPNSGILRLGKLVPNITPASCIIKPDENAIQERFLNRVLIHNFRSKKDIKQIVEFLRSLGLSAVIHSQDDLGPYDVYSYKENRKYNNSDYVFIVSSRNPHKPDDLRDIILGAERKFTNVSGTEGKDFKIIEYDTKSKPLKDKIYDSIFYFEKWSLLTPGEKILRCCFSVLSLTIPIIPIIIMLYSFGNLQVREKAYKANLLPWQYRKYKKPRSIYDILDSLPEQKKENVLLKLKKEAQKRGFLELVDGEYKATDLEGKVSLKNNLLLIESKSSLNRKQWTLRVITFLLLTLVCITKILTLICHFLKADKAALYCSIISYSVIFAVGLSLISLKTTPAKICAGICIVLSLTFLLLNVASLLLGTDFSYELMLSGVLAAVTGVMLTVALVCHRFYKRDRELVSKLGGISITSYISMKDYVQDLCKIGIIELEGCEFESSYGTNIAVFNAYKAGVFGDLQSIQEEAVDQGDREDSVNCASSTPTLEDGVDRIEPPSADIEDLRVTAKEDVSRHRDLTP